MRQTLIRRSVTHRWPQAATPTAIVLPPRSENGHAMLNNLSEQIRDCLQHAEDCARKAAAQPDGSKLRQDFLAMEQHWLSLARTFQLGERLDDFTHETTRKASAPITPFLRDQAFDPETVEAMAKAFVTTGAWVEQSR